MPDGDPVMGPDMRVSIAQRPKITGLDGWLGGAPFVMLTSLLAAQKKMESKFGVFSVHGALVFTFHLLCNKGQAIC